MSNTRKSISILKPPKVREPLQDLNQLLPNNDDDDEPTSTTDLIRKRRVSFASIRVKEFQAEAESAVVLHTPAYEEQFSVSSDSYQSNIGYSQCENSVSRKSFGSHTYVSKCSVPSFDASFMVRCDDDKRIDDIELISNVQLPQCKLVSVTSDTSMEMTDIIFQCSPSSEIFSDEENCEPDLLNCSADGLQRNNRKSNVFGSCSAINVKEDRLDSIFGNENPDCCEDSILKTRHSDSVTGGMPGRSRESNIFGQGSNIFGFCSKVIDSPLGNEDENEDSILKTRHSEASICSNMSMTEVLTLNTEETNTNNMFVNTSMDPLSMSSDNVETANVDVQMSVQKSNALKSVDLPFNKTNVLPVNDVLNSIDNSTAYKVFGMDKTAAMSTNSSNNLTNKKVVSMSIDVSMEEMEESLLTSDNEETIRNETAHDGHSLYNCSDIQPPVQQNGHIFKTTSMGIANVLSATNVYSSDSEEESIQIEDEYYLNDLNRDYCSGVKAEDADKAQDPIDRAYVQFAALQMNTFDGCSSSIIHPNTETNSNPNTETNSNPNTETNSNPNVENYKHKSADTVSVLLRQINPSIYDVSINKMIGAAEKCTQKVVEENETDKCVRHVVDENETEKCMYEATEENVTEKCADKVIDDSSKLMFTMDTNKTEKHSSEITISSLEKMNLDKCPETNGNPVKRFTCDFDDNTPCGVDKIKCISLSVRSEFTDNRNIKFIESPEPQPCHSYNKRRSIAKKRIFNSTNSIDCVSEEKSINKRLCTNDTVNEGSGILTRNPNDSEMGYGNKETEKVSEKPTGQQIKEMPDLIEESSIEIKDELFVEQIIQYEENNEMSSSIALMSENIGEHMHVVDRCGNGNVAVNKLANIEDNANASESNNIELCVSNTKIKIEALASDEVPELNVSVDLYENMRNKKLTYVIPDTSANVSVSNSKEHNIVLPSLSQGSSNCSITDMSLIPNRGDSFSNSALLFDIANECDDSIMVGKLCTTPYENMNNIDNENNTNPSEIRVKNKYTGSLDLYANDAKSDTCGNVSVSSSHQHNIVLPSLSQGSSNCSISDMSIIPNLGDSFSPSTLMVDIANECDRGNMSSNLCAVPYGDTNSIAVENNTDPSKIIAVSDQPITPSEKHICQQDTSKVKNKYTSGLDLYENLPNSESNDVMRDTCANVIVSGSEKCNIVPSSLTQASNNCSISPNCGDSFAPRTSMIDIANECNTSNTGGQFCATSCGCTNSTAVENNTNPSGITAVFGQPRPHLEKHNIYQENKGRVKNKYTSGLCSQSPDLQKSTCYLDSILEIQNNLRVKLSRSYSHWEIKEFCIGSWSFGCLYGTSELNVTFATESKFDGKVKSVALRIFPPNGTVLKSALKSFERKYSTEKLHSLCRCLEDVIILLQIMTPDIVYVKQFLYYTATLKFTDGVKFGNNKAVFYISNSEKRILTKLQVRLDDIDIINSSDIEVQQIIGKVDVGVIKHIFCTVGKNYDFIRKFVRSVNQYIESSIIPTMNS